MSSFKLWVKDRPNITRRITSTYRTIRSAITGGLRIAWQAQPLNMASNAAPQC